MFSWKIRTTLIASNRNCSRVWINENQISNVASIIKNNRWLCLILWLSILWLPILWLPILLLPILRLPKVWLSVSYRGYLSLSSLMATTLTKIWITTNLTMIKSDITIKYNTTLITFNVSWVWVRGLIHVDCLMLLVAKNNRLWYRWTRLTEKHSF